MTATLPPQIRFQPLVAGLPLPAGKVYFYQATTSTPQGVFAADGTTPLTNPVILDADGAADFRLGSGLIYKINVTDSNDVQQPGWPVDNVPASDFWAIALQTRLANPAVITDGDAMIAVKQDFTGALGRTQHQKNAENLNAADFGTDIAGTIAAIGSVPCTVTVSSAITANADAIVPVTLTLRIVKGGTINVATGKLFTYQGDTSLWDMHTIFTGSGSVLGIRHALPEWFGDVTTDAGIPINKAFAAIVNNGSIELIQADYPISTTVKFPEGSSQLRLFSNNNSKIRIVPDGFLDCIDCTALNENLSGHSIDGLWLQGKNNYYADQMTNSTGSGIRMQRIAGDTTNTATAYNCTINRCKIYGFKYGIRIRSAINCHFNYCDIRFNRNGVYFDGGQSNKNDFVGCMITTNDLGGVWSNGTIGGTLTDATLNIFNNCILESNHPYTYTGLSGVAIYLNNSYDFTFNDCYSEDHQYDVILTNNAKGNIFRHHRADSGGAGAGAILLSGAGVWNNKWINCKAIIGSLIAPNVESDNAGQLGNQFLDCEGYNFIAANLLSMPFVRNNTRNNNIPASRGYSFIGMAENGFVNGVAEGTGPGQIQGIGTATAILHTRGCGEWMLNSGITAATTITAIEGAFPSQILTLWTNQNAYAITIKHNPTTLVLKGGTDKVLSAINHSITLYIKADGTAVEIGDNI